MHICVVNNNCLHLINEKRIRRKNLHTIEYFGINEWQMRKPSEPSEYKKTQIGYNSHTIHSSHVKNEPNRNAAISSQQQKRFGESQISNNRWHAHVNERLYTFDVWIVGIKMNAVFSVVVSIIFVVWIWTLISKQYWWPVCMSLFVARHMLYVNFFWVSLVFCCWCLSSEHKNIT